MKISISRQNLYLLALSVFLLLFVFFFSFLVLIPEGQDYRKQHIELKVESRELQKYQNFSDETYNFLKKLQSDNKHTIMAFDNNFKVERFYKQYKNYFSSLHISQKVMLKSEEDFDTYEVNTTSKISSPKSFYDFIEAVNKSDWIVSIDFPIHFKRSGEMISSSFKMKVYGTHRDLNTTK
jgi:hypothetical protein